MSGARVTWTRQDPPGGGPSVALAAATALPGVATARSVVVLAGDLPFIGQAVTRLLGRLTECADLDAVLGVDPDGRRQPLLAVAGVAR